MQEDIQAYYYQDKPIGGFIFQFPGGTINPGEYKVVALDSPSNIQDKFGANVDYDVGLTYHHFKQGCEILDINRNKILDGEFGIRTKGANYN